MPSLTIPLAWLDRSYFTPEQFGAVGDGETDDTEAIQACIDAAANWSSAAFARRVLLSAMYRTTATILKRPYVSLFGVGMARCGLKPALSSGPAIAFDVASDTSAYLDDFSGFRIDGADCTGVAYALLLRGQKHVRFNRVGFWNFMATDVHTVQVLDGCYSVVFDQCYWMSNRRHEDISASSPSDTFPTTVTHLACVFEARKPALEAPWSHEAIKVRDASGIAYAQDCVFQGNDQKHLFSVTSSTVLTTSALHRWVDCYFEDNGGGQSGAGTWKFVGNPSNPLSGCTVRDNRIHGAAPEGGHIYAESTTRLAVVGNSVPADHKWLTDGGGNLDFDIDARHVGVCELQTVRYNTTSFAFTDSETVTTPQQDALRAVVAKQATGRYDVQFNRDVKTVAAFVQVTAFDAGGDAMSASGYFSTVSLFKVRVNQVGTTAAATPSRVFVTIAAEIQPA